MFAEILPSSIDNEHKKNKTTSGALSQMGVPKHSTAAYQRSITGKEKKEQDGEREEKKYRNYDDEKVTTEKKKEDTEVKTHNKESEDTRKTSNSPSIQMPLYLQTDPPPPLSLEKNPSSQKPQSTDLPLPLQLKKNPSSQKPQSTELPPPPKLENQKSSQQKPQSTDLPLPLQLKKKTSSQQRRQTPKLNKTPSSTSQKLQATASPRKSELKKEFNELNLTSAVVVDNSSSKLLRIDFKVILEMFGGRNLKEISLRENHLNEEQAQRIANTLKDHHTLLVLDLAHNEIGDKGCLCISDLLNVTNCLKDLQLSDNQISSVEAAIKLGKALEANKSLQNLNVSSNNFRDEGCEHISKSLTINQSLLSINLAHNNIGCPGAEKIANSLLKNTTLTELWLCRNAIQIKGAHALGNLLKGSKALKHIFLGNNMIGNDGAHELAKGFANNKILETLSIHNNNISDQGLVYFGDAMQNNRTLTKLMLGTGDQGSNSIALYGTQALGTVLTDNIILNELYLPKGQYLDDHEKNDVVRESLYKAMDLAEIPDQMLIFWEKVKYSRGPEKVDNKYAIDVTPSRTTSSTSAIEQEAYLEEKSYENLTTPAMVRKANPSIQKTDFPFEILTGRNLTNLSLRDNNLDETQAERIANMLKSYDTLAVLDLSHNKIGNKGCKELGQALESNKSLQILSISCNNLQDVGCKHIAQSLKTNETLVSINLGDNSIGCGGAKQISRNILRNTTLTDLWLHKNGIGKFGAEAIGNLLKQNKTLKHIFLGHNSIGDEGTCLLAKGFSENNNLETLSIHNNNISDQGLTYFGNSMKGNSALTKLMLGTGGDGSNCIALFATLALGIALTENRVLTELYLPQGRFLDEDGKIHEKNDLIRENLYSCLDVASLPDNMVLFWENKKYYKTPESESAPDTSVLPPKKSDSSTCAVKLEAMMQENPYKKITSISLNKGLAVKGSPHLETKLIQNMLTSGNVSKLWLTESNLSEEQSKSIANALEKNDCLHVLDLSNNLIRNKGCVDIAGFLKISTCIKDLRLNSNSINSIEAADKLRDALELNKSLIVLSLCNNNLRDQGCGYISRSLKINQNLRSINLGANNIGCIGAEIIATNLLENSSLTDLWLHKNLIRDAGAQAIGNLLKQNKTLKNVFLGENTIGNSGARELAGGLCDNESLETLSLRNNNISDEGIVCFGTAMQKNHTLTRLILGTGRDGTNHFALKGAFALINAFTDNKVLKDLYLPEGVLLDDRGMPDVTNDTMRGNLFTVIDVANLPDQLVIFWEKLRYSKRLENEDSEDTTNCKTARRLSWTSAIELETRIQQTSY